MATKKIEAIYPLSPLQQGMLFDTLYAPESGVYVEQFVCTLRGLMIAPFEQAWQQIVARHPVLRTAFVWEKADTPLQVVGRQVKLPFDQRDWRALSPDAQNQQLQRFLAADRKRGFKLSRAPLMRLTLIQVADDTYTFVWSHHHLLLDGWSMALVLQEVFLVYQGLCTGQLPRLETRRPYADYIAWLQQQNLLDAELYWRQELRGFTAPTPLMSSPTVGMEGANSDTAARYSEAGLLLPSATTAALQELAQQQQLTLNTLIQGAWALLLGRTSGEADVLFGVTVSGRPATLLGVETMLGLFINTLPLRVRVPPDAALLPWLHDLQAQQAEMRQYEHSPLPQVHKWSDVPPGVPLFENIFIFENYPIDAALQEENDGLQIVDLRAIEQTNYPLTLSVIPGHELRFQLNHDERRFEATTADRLLTYMQTLLDGMLAQPAQRIADLPLLSAAERQQILVAWNATATPFPQEQCLHQLVAAQASRTPDALAVVFDATALSYRELLTRAIQLAHYLRSLGVGSDTLVGLYLERSLELPLALLGVLLAGGAYMPLDPAFPSERLAFMIADAALPVLLTQSALRDQAPATAPCVVCLDSDWPQIAAAPATSPQPVSPDNLAYAIYTSGSTGQPKGVQIPHRAVVNFLTTMAARPGLTAYDTLLSVTTLSFDIAGLELWLPLLVGARVVIVPRAVAADGARLSVQLVRQQVTLMQATPATWRLLLAADWPGDERLTILCGGEMLPRDLAEQLHARCAALWNMYGPTETTIWSTIQPLTAGDGPVLIGRPIANTTIYVLDGRLQPVPAGVAGELYIGGVGLARGYRNRADLTAERFVPNPFAGVLGDGGCGAGGRGHPTPNTRHPTPGCIGPAIRCATGRLVSWSTWGGWTSRSRCAASGSSWARSRPR